MIILLTKDNYGDREKIEREREREGNKLFREKIIIRKFPETFTDRGKISIDGTPKVNGFERGNVRRKYIHAHIYTIEKEIM